MPGPHSWSVDPSSNDVADPGIFLAEGQAPPTLNNAQRAVMAGIKRQYLDETGALTATGAATGALAVSTNQGFVATDLPQPSRLTVFVDATNSGPVTLNVDGTGAKPLRRIGGFDLAPGDLSPAIPYRILRVPSLDVYLVEGAGIERPGRMAEFAVASAVPPGWVICDGRALSRVSYAALRSVLGDTYGAGDGSTTFNVPDLRGRTTFGADNMGGTAANRLTGAGGINGSVGSVGGAEAVALTVNQLASHNHTGSTQAGGGQAATSTGASGAHDHGGATAAAGGHNHTGTTNSAGGHNHSGATDSGGAHTHPITHQVQVGYQGGGGGQAYAVQAIAPAGSGNVGTTDSGGVHGHNFTTGGVGDHQHGFTTGGVADHAHGITGAPNHAHTVSAVDPHTHGLSIDAAGQSQAHPNLPPGLVLVRAIKA